MRSIVSPKLLARLVCVIFYHLRRSSAAHRDFCGPKAIGQMLQYFQFLWRSVVCTREAGFVRDLDILPDAITLRSRCAGVNNRGRVRGLSGALPFKENQSSI
jgi:hypothetical protein